MQQEAAEPPATENKPSSQWVQFKVKIKPHKTIGLGIVFSQLLGWDTTDSDNQLPVPASDIKAKDSDLGASAKDGQNSPVPSFLQVTFMKSLFKKKAQIGPAASQGVEVGDVLLEYEGMRVRNMRHLNHAIKRAADPHVSSRTQGVSLTLTRRLVSKKKASTGATTADADTSWRCGRRVVEAKFGRGPLGIGIYADNDKSPVVVKRFIPNKAGMAPPIALCKYVGRGFRVVGINGEDVRSETFTSVRNMLKRSHRPVVIHLQHLKDAELYNPFNRGTPRVLIDLRDLVDEPMTRTKEFEVVLSDMVIDEKNLRTMAFGGIPDDDQAPGLRSKVWQILHGHLSWKPSHWERDREAGRDGYALFCNQMITDPSLFEMDPGQLRKNDLKMQKQARRERLKREREEQQEREVEAKRQQALKAKEDLRRKRSQKLLGSLIVDASPTTEESDDKAFSFTPENAKNERRAEPTSSLFESDDDDAEGGDKGLFDADDKSAEGGDKGLFDADDKSAVGGDKGLFDSDDKSDEGDNKGLFDADDKSAEGGNKGLFDTDDKSDDGGDKGLFDADDKSADVGDKGLFETDDKSDEGGNKGLFDADDKSAEGGDKGLFGTDSTVTGAAGNNLFGSDDDLEADTTAPPQPPTSEGENAPDPSTSENAPDPSTSENAPDPSTNENAPDPSTNENAPDPATNENAPDPSASENAPDPTTNDDKAAAASAAAAASTEQEEEYSLEFEVSEDCQLFVDIHKDVVRTHPGLSFFNNTKGNRLAMKRILYVWARLNKRIAYVQGMNELLAPLYYVVATDPTVHPKRGATDQEKDQCRLIAEADCFCLFTKLMGEVGDLFTKQLDTAYSGVAGTLKQFDEIFDSSCPSLAGHLKSLGVLPHFYAFRWVTTLGSREMTLPETVRLWDSVFADKERLFLDYFCVAMVISRMNDLMGADFATCLRILQHEPLRSPFDEVFRTANHLRNGAVYGPDGQPIMEDPKARRSKQLNEAKAKLVDFGNKLKKGVAGKVGQWGSSLREWSNKKKAENEKKRQEHDKSKKKTTKKRAGSASYRYTRRE